MPRERRDAGQDERDGEGEGGATKPAGAPPRCRTWSLAEAAALLGVSDKHLGELAIRGEVPSLVLGARRVVPKRGLLRGARKQEGA